MVRLVVWCVKQSVANHATGFMCAFRRANDNNRALWHKPRLFRNSESHEAMAGCLNCNVSEVTSAYFTPAAVLNTTPFREESHTQVASR
jgi:hypothetical protein